MVEHHFPNFLAAETLRPDGAASITNSVGGNCLTYFLGSVAAGCWIGIDDLEFRAEDDLSGDDVAQVLFVLTGGEFDFEGSCGQCKGYQVIYELAKPAQLMLKPLHAVGVLKQPALYYLS